MTRFWRSVLCVAVVVATLIGVALGVRVDTDLNTFFTAQTSRDAAFFASLLQSGELSRRYLLAVESETDAVPSADALADRLRVSFESTPGVERVWRADQLPPEWAAAITDLAEHHASVFSLEPGIAARTVFAASHADERADRLRNALLSPAGPWLKDVAKRDPLLLTAEALGSLRAPLFEAAGSGSREVGLILIAQAPALDTEAHARLQAELKDRFAHADVELGGGGHLAMTGVPVFAVAAHAQVAHDVAWVSGISSISVVLVFLLVCRSLQALWWVSLMLAGAFAVGAGATAWMFGSVHSLTLALGSTLTGVSVDYPLHVLAHSAQAPEASPREAARHVWPSLCAGALTTVLGYVALGFCGFPGFQQIAVFAAAAILATLAMTRWVLPGLIANLRLVPIRLGVVDAWLQFCGRRRRALQGLLLLGVLIACAQLPEVAWMDDLSRLTMDMSDLKARDRALRARMGGIEPGRFVLAEGADLESALQRGELAERILRGLEQTSALQAHFGVYPWVVSDRLQRENLETYADAATGPYGSAWREAVGRAGLSMEKLGRLTPAGAPVSPLELLERARSLVGGQVLRAGANTAVVIWLGPHDPAAVEAALRPVEGVRYFSQKSVLDRLAASYRGESLRALGWGLVGIFAVLWLRYRRARYAWASLLPAVIASIALFALWAALGQEVSFVHLLCLLLAVSICEDYGIFFLDNRGGDAKLTYQAIAPSMLTTVASFAALGLAHNPTLKIIGVAVTLGVLLGYLLCPLVIQPREVPAPQ